MLTAVLTPKTRAGLPREFIPLRVAEISGSASAVLFLTCDLYGVLPPVAKLTKEQAAYYFLSGYTRISGQHRSGSRQRHSTNF